MSTAPGTQLGEVRLLKLKKMWFLPLHSISHYRLHVSYNVEDYGYIFETMWEKVLSSNAKLLYLHFLENRENCFVTLGETGDYLGMN
jgi:hypothetical protein